MNSRGDLRKLLPLYLLGELTPEESAEIDERYFSDKEFADVVEEVRRDLLDSLAAGELSAEDRARVEKALAQIPEGEGVLRVARALQAKQEKTAQAGRFSRGGIGGLSWIWAAAAVLLCVVTLAVVVKERDRLQGRAAVETSRTAPAPPAAPAPKQGTAQNEAAFVVLLSPEVSRGAEASQSFAVPNTARFVEFQIVLRGSDGKTRYEASVSYERGSNPLIFSDLEAKSIGAQRYLEFRTAASLLPPGKYAVRVYAETRGRPLLASYEIALSEEPVR